MEPALSETRGRLVSVVLVTWNSADYLPRCLDGISAQSWPDLEVIAVDNDSTDDSVATLYEFQASSRRPFTLIRNTANAGFARAVNQAIEVSRGEFVLLANPDAYLEPGYIVRLVAAFDEAGQEFGAATGTLIRGEGSEIRPTEIIDSKGIRMTRSGRHLDIGQGRRNGEDDRGMQPLHADAQRQEVFGVSGAAAMYRRRFIDDVTIDGQFLDEDFFSYREDADVAWRGRVFGWHALHAGDAIAVHVRTVTPSRRRDLTAVVNMHSVKNRFLLRLKNEGLYLAFRNAFLEIPRDIITIGAVLTIERTSLPGLTWIWRNRTRVLAHRRAIQSRRRTPDRALARWFR